jgi:hypothetical protein
MMPVTDNGQLDDPLITLYAPPNQRPVHFVHTALLKVSAELGQCYPMFWYDQQTTGIQIEAMYRVGLWIVALKSTQHAVMV